MKTILRTTLATITPSISIQTIWEPDQDSGPISKECDGFDPSEDDEWEAWQSEIRATAIHDGEEITGSAYLGGTFERYGDNPAVSNPTISGYENQMTREAFEELRSGLPVTSPLLSEISAALEYLEAESSKEWEAQQSARA